jgi:Fe-coproporphyrin III synthase
VCAQVARLPEIARIEADPRGALTMSCKAVGMDSHAFWYDKAANRIVHRSSTIDELTLAVPDVVYARV